MLRINKITIFLTMVFYLSMSIPTVWSDTFHFGEVPLGFVVFSILFIVWLPRLIRHSVGVSRPLLAAFAAFVLMMLVGFLRGNIDTYALKFYMADVFCFWALLMGYAFSRTQKKEATASMVLQSCVFACILIIVNYIGLFTGILPDEFNVEGRRVSIAIYGDVGILLILMPWATMSLHRKDKAGGLRTLYFFVIAGGTGLLSATRSIVIETVLCAGLYLLLKRRQFSAGFMLRLAAGTGVLVLILTSSLFGTFVFSRLRTTNITEESRTEEIELMWPQINGDLITGQGMGSRFVSNVVVNGNPLASAPHVGILTFLMKGGVPLFIGFALAPLIVSLYVLFSPRFPESQRGAAASTIMFLAMSCMSGGWSPLALFPFGLALGAVSSSQRSVIAPSRRQEELIWNLPVASGRAMTGQ